MTEKTGQENEAKRIVEMLLEEFLVFLGRKDPYNEDENGVVKKRMKFCDEVLEKDEKIKLEYKGRGRLTYPDPKYPERPYGCYCLGVEREQLLGYVKDHEQDGTKTLYAIVGVRGEDFSKFGIFFAWAHALGNLAVSEYWDADKRRKPLRNIKLKHFPQRIIFDEFETSKTFQSEKRV